MPNLLTKAIKTLTTRQAIKMQGRGTLSGFALGVSPLWGQPYPEVVAEDASGLISRQRMREVILRTPTVGACVNAILDFTGGVKISVRNIDHSKPVSPYKANKAKRLLRQPNTDQTGRQFLMALIRDIITFGYGALEIAQTNNLQRPINLWVMDSARLRIDFTEHGLVRGYDMLDARGIPIIGKKLRGGNADSIYSFPHGMNMGNSSLQSVPSYTDSSVDANWAPGTDLHGWEPSEVIFFSLNPISESVYPNSRIVQLFTAAILEDLMMQFIADRFTDSNIPFGVFDLGDVTEDELRTAIDNWNAQGKTGNRILMTGSKGAGSKWVPFGYHLKDLEAVELLKELRMKIMGVLGVTMQELGESQDINKSNGYNLSFTFKKRAVEPVLDEVTETLTRRLLWDTLGYDDLEYYYEEIDSRDDFLMSQIDTNYEKLGIYQPNEIRNRRGLPNIPGGDENLIFTGNSWIPLELVRKLAEQIIMIEQASGGGVAVTGPESADTLRFHSGGKQELGQNAAAEVGQSNGHKRGASSELARQLTGQK